MSRHRHAIIARSFDKRGRLLSEASNSYSKSHPIQAYFAKKVGHDARIYLHAEIHAIIKAGDKKIHRLEVTRITSQGKPALAKPCPVCMEAIRAYGIQHVEYSK